YQTAGDLVDAVEAAAARIGVAPTPNLLGRFMREWFGEPTEPWLELSAADSNSVITVSSEPILAAPTIETAQLVAEQLRHAPTLPPTEVDVESLRAAAARAAQGRKVTVKTVASPARLRSTPPERAVTDPVGRRRGRAHWLLVPTAVVVALALVGIIATLES